MTVCRLEYFNLQEKHNYQMELMCNKLQSPRVPLDNMTSGRGTSNTALVEKSQNLIVYLGI